MKHGLSIGLFVFFAEILSFSVVKAQPQTKHNLQFTQLARTWDEGLPLGNGMIGALIWQKDANLRFSLDRADLWDLRPMPDIQARTYKWVVDQVRKKDYKPVQEWGDVPYEREAAPSKIPGAALEFSTGILGDVTSAKLDIAQALSEVTWKNGAKLETFVHATQPIGAFRFENVPSDFVPVLVPPKYAKDANDVVNSGDSVAGNDLRQLGYKQGTVEATVNQIVYDQEGWGGFKYKVAVTWQRTGSTLEGVWSITSNFEQKPNNANVLVQQALTQGWAKNLASHKTWWQTFWQQSDIHLPDELMEKQWYLDTYKLGATSRQGAPPISLQAVWTADNGRIPPWKGDFHHDLNTQLSYWSSYSANHLPEAKVFTDWIWKYKPVFERWTKQYFGTDGLDVPGVTTLTGEPMGGWIQYSLSPSTSAWLAQHYYLEWRFSMDRTFLTTRAYPFIQKVAKHFEQLTVYKNGVRQFPLSSSPEFHDNDILAWSEKTTNYDLSLMRWTFAKASEMATALGKTAEARHYSEVLKTFPELATDAAQGLKVTPDELYHESHRHFSHLLSIHPLGLYDWNAGTRDQQIMQKSIANLEKQGSDYWTGYSFSWLGNIYARAKMGDKAAQVLRLFASCFVLPNSFHVNGDQCGGKYSKFTYRPFTLEGNFAYASGVQEMLLQSQSAAIEVFPALPLRWQNVSFNQLRAQGAFLVSAEKRDGNVGQVQIKSEQGGTLRLVNPFGDQRFAVQGVSNWRKEGALIIAVMQKGQSITLKRE
jgi:alpha-L-fucosidase 2